MRTVVLAMFTSLDGYIEGPGNQLVPPPYSPDLRTHWIDRNMERAGTMMFGRVAYEGMADFWRSPKAPAAQAEALANMDKLVFSRTLQVADWGKVAIVRDDIAGEIARRKAEGDRDMVLIAGAGIARTFLELGLIDELCLLVSPLLLGGGTRLFTGGYDRTPLQLTEALPFDSGAVRLTYRRS
jgi:dihydrofolate reductase